MIMAGPTIILSNSNPLELKISTVMFQSEWHRLYGFHELPPKIKKKESEDDNDFSTDGIILEIKEFQK
jgi:hypothetical protein